MPDIHEVATVTSKGQMTLPKPIRQALGATIASTSARCPRGWRRRCIANARHAVSLDEAIDGDAPLPDDLLDTHIVL